MTTAIAPARYGRVKRYGYLIFLTSPLLPFAGYLMALVFGADNAFAWFTLFYVYVLIPIADMLIGQDPVNARDEEVTALSDDRYYRWLTWLCVPIMVLSLATGAWLFVHWEALTIVGQIGWAMSFGTLGAVIGINAAHELIHKDSRFEQRLGGFLLCTVCYPGFKIEHVRGHHVNVSTPNDPSSARYNQSLYGFLPVTIRNNVASAWRLEAERLQRKGLPVFSHRNELLRWYALTLAIAAGITLWLGVAGLVFFLVQSAVAIVLLEIVNYLEHYGLRRRRLDNGRYERTTHLHSWNSNYLLTNMLLFQLQRHSDHHAWPRRRYQVLRHFDDSPQLPAGYTTMIMLALVPPLWRRVMNPRVEAYYRDQPELLQLQAEGA